MRSAVFGNVLSDAFIVSSHCFGDSIVQVCLVLIPYSAKNIILNVEINEKKNPIQNGPVFYKMSI